MKWKPIFTLLAIASLVCFSQVDACPVCFSDNPKTRAAFYFTTAFLTVLPLSFVGGVVFWLKKRFERLAETDGE